MLKLICEEGYALIETNDINKNINDGNYNISCDAYLKIDDNFYRKVAGYVQLGEVSFIDFCDDFYDENGNICSVDMKSQCPILSIEYYSYDMDFVEHFHPNYNCDEIAWLDDCWCALENEVDNGCHWDYLASIVNTEEERERCRRIYENGLESDDDVDFGEELSDTYKERIEEDICYYEDKIMGAAIDGFCKEYNIKLYDREDDEGI